MKREAVRTGLVVGLALAIGGELAFAQASAPGAWNTDPAAQANMVYQQYASSAHHWAEVGLKYAKTLFGLLAAIDLGWTMIQAVIGGDEGQSFIAKLLRWILKTGFFWALLVNGQSWMSAIIGSFVKIGQEAGNTTTVAPSEILGIGVALAGNICLWAVKMMTVDVLGVGVGLAGMIASLLVVIAFAIVSLNFIITTIEAFLVLGAGFIFLGFGGSEWTRSSTMRYLGVATSIGSRLMVLYMVIGLGNGFGQQWNNAVLGLTGEMKPIGDAWTVMVGVLAGSFTYAGVALMCPKLIASVASGAVSGSANEAIGAAMGAALAGTAIGGLGVAAGGGMWKGGKYVAEKMLGGAKAAAGAVASAGRSVASMLPEASPGASKGVTSTGEPEVMPPIGTLSSGATASGAGRSSGSGGGGGTQGSSGNDNDAPLPPIPPRPPNYRPPSGGTALPSQPHTMAGAPTNESASLPNGAPSIPPAPIETPGRSATETLPSTAGGNVAGGDGVARSEAQSTGGADTPGTQTEPPTAAATADAQVDAGTTAEGSPQTWAAETSQTIPEAPWTATGETSNPAFHATQLPDGDASATEAQPKAEAPAPPEKQDIKERQRSALEHLAVLHAVKDLADSGHADVEPPPPPGKGE